MHGHVVRCVFPNPGLQELLIRPFERFVASEGAAGVTVKVVDAPFPYEDYPELLASFSTPRNVVYDTKDLKVVDYFGNGATVEDKNENSFTIHGSNSNFLQEAFYLLMLSIFGQYCDRAGMLRVHAMAISYRDKAILMPIPPGGGKSTMAISLLKDKEIKLISDDEPIISRSGSVLPFALRIGTLNEDVVRSIPERFVYSVDRMEFGSKYFIDVAYWADQLEHRALNDIVYVAGNRILNGEPVIRSVAKHRVLKSLFRDSIVGVGLYQGLEFSLSNSPFSVASKVSVVFRRALVAWKLLRRSRTYQFLLSRDVEKNRRVFMEFLRELESR